MAGPGGITKQELAASVTNELATAVEKTAWNNAVTNLNGFRFRLNGTALEYSTDGVVWNQMSGASGGFVKASDNLKLSADDLQQQVITGTLTLLKSVKIFKTGQIRLKVDYAVDYPTSMSGPTGRIQIKRSTSLHGSTGAGTGILDPLDDWTFSNRIVDGWSTRTIDVDVNTGDVISIFVSSSSGSEPASIRNFRIYFDQDDTMDGIVLDA